MLEVLKNYIQPPVYPDNPDRTWAAVTVDALLLFHMATVIIFAGIGLLYSSNRAGALEAAIAFLLLLAGMRLLVQRRLRLAVRLYCLAVFIVMTGFILATGNLSSPVVMAYLAGVTVTAILVGLRASTAFGAAAVLCLFAMGVARGAGILPVVRPPGPGPTFAVLVNTMLYMMIPLSITFRSLRMALLYAREQLAERQKVEAELRQNMAELKRTETAHSASEQRLRTIISNLPVILFALDKNGVFTLSEGKGLELVGVKPGAIVGESIRDRYVTQPALREKMEEALAGRLTRDSYEVNHTIFDVVYTPMFDEEGGANGLIAVAMDITEQRRSEEALRLSEMRYRTLAELMSDYAYSYTVHPDMTYTIDWLTAEPFYRMTGVRFDDFRNSISLYHPDDIPKMQEDMQELLQGKQVSSEYRIIVKSGEQRYVYITRYPVFDETTGRLIRFFGVAQDITARKEAEIALRQSEETARRFQERLKLLYETSLELSRCETFDALYYAAIDLGCRRLGFDRLGLFLVSPAGDTLNGTYGVAASGEIRDIHELALPITMPSYITQSLSQGKQAVYKENVDLRDGRREIVGHGWNATAILWNGDEAIGWLTCDNLQRQEAISPMQLELLTLYSSMLGNIITQRRTQDALRRSEERLKLALDSANDGLWDWDMVTGEGYYSPRYYTIRGYEPYSFPPTYEQWRTSVHPDDLERVDTRQFDRFRNEYRMKTITGEYIWIMDRGQVVARADNGEPVRVIGTISDISDRKRAEVALRESEEKFRAIFELAPSASVIARTDGTVIDANQASLLQMGRPLEDVMDNNCIDLKLIPSREAFEGLLQLLDNNIPVEGVEATVERPDGQRRAVLSAARYLYLGGEKHLLMTGTDITRLKQAEQEILTLNAELEQRVIRRTARLEATNKELEAFAYSVSHDLRAPLRSLDGFSQALLEDYSSVLDDVAQDYLARIRSASQHMGAMIDALLSLSRITRSEIHTRTVNLSAIATEVIRGLREAEPHRQVNVEIEPNLTAGGDEPLLRIALQNLLQNAWKYTGKKSDALIRFGKKIEEGYDVFFVEDNGAGFDMAYADRLYGAFQRLHAVSEFPGTGVGLATVQRIILRHGGEVSAIGAPGKGATFFFTLDTLTENYAAHNPAT